MHGETNGQQKDEHLISQPAILKQTCAKKTTFTVFTTVGSPFVVARSHFQSSWGNDQLIISVTSLKKKTEPYKQYSIFKGILKRNLLFNSIFSFVSVNNMKMATLAERPCAKDHPQHKHPRVQLLGYDDGGLTTL